MRLLDQLVARLNPKPLPSPMLAEIRAQVERMPEMERAAAQQRLTEIEARIATLDVAIDVARGE